MKTGQITALTGVSKQTLNNWRKHKPDLYAIVVRGCEEVVADSGVLVKIMLGGDKVTVFSDGEATEYNQK